MFTLDEPISQESDMTGYFVFASAILEKEDSVIELPDKTTQLVGMYPLYKEEFNLMKRIGIKDKIFGITRTMIYTVLIGLI
ncbi:hypothetical protein ACXHJ2_22835 [Paenibacillus sp. ALE3]|uniref:hypothetical protein n=1 Tax=Paenibacillus sp. EKM207P TaxID=1683675 RepID=UPI001EEA5C9D|nr:hypothetical protein [Paenibacillus sp. EKM207P]